MYYLDVKSFNVKFYIKISFYSLSGQLSVEFNPNGENWFLYYMMLFADYSFPRVIRVHSSTCPIPS